MLRVFLLRVFSMRVFSMPVFSMPVFSMRAFSRANALCALTLGCLFCTCASAQMTEAAQGADAAGPAAAVSLQQGGIVQFCAPDARCRQNRHPAAAGKVREIVAGNFVAAAPASWIALGERAASLCYLNGASGAITCAPIANGADFARATRISSVGLGDGSHTLKFAARSGNQASWEASYSPYLFMASLSAAADLLSRHAAQHDGARDSPGNPPSANGGGADLCALGNGGGVTCTGTDGEAAPAETARANPLARRSDYQLPAAQSDPNHIATVETGAGAGSAAGSGGSMAGGNWSGADRSGAGPAAPDRQCTAAMNEHIASCNDLGRRFGDRSRQACVGSAESNFQECRGTPRGDDRQER